MVAQTFDIIFSLFFYCLLYTSIIILAISGVRIPGFNSPLMLKKVCPCQDIRVLLVEDNELNAEIAEFMLTENGAKVETVNNGLEAVQRFEASEPGTYDVILMDVMMPRCV